MNRAPSKNDLWWPQHQARCKGTFEKISEPEKVQQTSSSNRKIANQKTALSVSQVGNKTIENFFQPTSSIKISAKLPIPKSTVPSAVIIKKENSSQNIETFFSKKRKASDATGSASQEFVILDDKAEACSAVTFKQPRQDLIKLDDDDDIILISSSKKADFESNNNKSSNNQIECPICFSKVSLNYINSHIDAHF